MYIKSLAFLASKLLSPYDMYDVAKELNLSPTVINDMYSANSDFKVIAENINDVKFKFLMEIDNDINEKKSFYDDEICNLDLNKEFDDDGEDWVLGETRLHIAIGLNLKSVVKALIGKGADLNIKGNHHREKLAVRVCDDIEFGMIGRFYYKISPLQLALEYTRYCDNMDKYDRYKKYYLSFDYENISKLLIEKGADMNIKNRWGETPLYQAILMNIETIAIKLIVKGADPNVKDYYGNTPLHKATKNNLKNISRLLISKGVDLNIEDYYGQRPLIYATKNNMTIVSKLLIQKGVDVNIKYKSSCGRTPLHFAVENNMENIVRILIDYGANLNIKNKWGETPLFYAIEKKHNKIAKLLISKEADINIKNDKGQTPLDLMLPFN